MKDGVPWSSRDIRPGLYPMQPTNSNHKLYVHYPSAVWRILYMYMRIDNCRE